MSQEVTQRSIYQTEDVTICEDDDCERCFKCEYPEYYYDPNFGNHIDPGRPCTENNKCYRCIKCKSEKRKQKIRDMYDSDFKDVKGKKNC